MNLKIDAAVVVLYHPEECVFENVSTYINHVNTLYVIDNSTSEHSLLNRLTAFNNVEILHSGSNLGVAKGLNIALEKASSEQMSWLMTFDQDTSYKANDIDIFIQSFNTLKNDKIAMVSPLHNHELIINNTEEPFVDKVYVMTSANIVNVSIAQKVGGYDEKLFIDEVDHEFCFRLKDNGYAILENTTIAVNHTLGTRYKDNSKIKLYDPIRLYYMMRNYLYLKEKYHSKQTLFFKKRDKYLLKFFANQILYGKQRFQNLKMIFKGIRDYKNHKYGKLIDA